MHRRGQLSCNRRRLSLPPARPSAPGQASSEIAAPCSSWYEKSKVHLVYRLQLLLIADFVFENSTVDPKLHGHLMHSLVCLCNYSIMEISVHYSAAPAFLLQRDLRMATCSYQGSLEKLQRLSVHWMKKAKFILSSRGCCWCPFIVVFVLGNFQNLLLRTDAV